MGASPPLNPKSVRGPMQPKWQTNIASEFHILSLLTRLGFDATLSLGNRKQVDITVVLAEGRALTVDVKAVANRNDWPIGNVVNPSKDHFVILVSYESKFGDPQVSPRVWVVPSSDVQRFTKTGRFPVLHRKAIVESGEYEDAWHLLT